MAEPLDVAGTVYTGRVLVVPVAALEAEGEAGAVYTDAELELALVDVDPNEWGVFHVEPGGPIVEAPRLRTPRARSRALRVLLERGELHSSPLVRRRGSSRQARPGRRTRRPTARSPGSSDDDPEPPVRPALTPVTRAYLRAEIDRRRRRALRRERALWRELELEGASS